MPASAFAAKAATTTIPIVFIVGDDPVRLGLVASLNRPGGNVTGVNMFTSKLESKRLGLLRELVPTAALMAFLLDPNSSIAADRLKDIQEAAHAVGQQIQILHASSERELDTAFETLARIASRSAARRLRAHTSTAGVTKSSHWRHATPFPQSTNFASSPWPAA